MKTLNVKSMIDYFNLRMADQGMSGPAGQRYIRVFQMGWIKMANLFKKISGQNSHFPGDKRPKNWGGKTSPLLTTTFQRGI